MKFGDYVGMLVESDVEKEQTFTEDELEILKSENLKEIDPRSVTYGYGKEYGLKTGTITVKISPAVKGVVFNILFNEKGVPAIDGLAVLFEKHTKLTRENLKEFLTKSKEIVISFNEL